MYRQNMASTLESVHSYDIVKQIGSGSFGVVYLVKNKESKSEYLVMKQISLAKLDARQRLDAQKEILLLSTLSHPNIVSYRHSFENDLQQLHIIMDYCDGGDLYRKIIERKRIGVPFDERQLVQWFVQICLALKYIHERKILHRDLKTQNIFACDADNTVKVGDFGIARILDHTADLAATCIGTPYYLSPEVCQNRPYGTKTDVWALGCVLYELATFRHPFEGRHLTELLTKIVRGIYDPLPLNYSMRFRQLIAHMLKVNSNERPDVTTLLQREYVYEQASSFLNRSGRHDELAILEDLVQQKRKAKQELQNHSHRPILAGTIANRRHVGPGGGRPKSTVTIARKAYLEKKFRMYMPSAAGVRLPPRGRVGKPGNGPRKSLTPVLENHVPADPVPPSVDLIVEESEAKVGVEIEVSQASPASSKSQQSPNTDSGASQAEPNQADFGSTITKPVKKERKRWADARSQKVTVMVATSTITSITSAVKAESVSTPPISAKPKISSPKKTGQQKGKEKPSRNVASSVPSIPGAVDDGWPADESQVCEACGCQYVAGGQRQKHGGKLMRQCQACRLAKKQEAKPVISDSKSVFEKIECLRAELERSLGIEKFSRVYQNAKGASKSGQPEKIGDSDKSKLETLLFFEKAYLN